MNVILDAYYSLSKNLNKAKGETTSETEEGVVGEKLPELKLDMENDEILKLTKKWKKDWIESDVYAAWSTAGDDNENYWKGKQHESAKVDKRRPQIDNVIFQSAETYLPQVTQHNPEPLVTLGAEEMQTPENLAYATDLKRELADLADDLRLRLKLKGAARHWMIYLLGAVKHTWDETRNSPNSKVIRPQKLILDSSATVDEDGYTGEFIGEHRKLLAQEIIDFLEELGGEEGARKAITDLVGEDLGTDIGFIEWWTNKYMCWTLGETKNSNSAIGHVLLKKKNPHWNYDKETPAANSEEAAPENESEQEPELDENGQPKEQPAIPAAETPEPEMEQGFNHLPAPKMPFELLSVFNLGDQPVDNTSLMGQNLASQDLINKRVKQIDKNADSMNGGMVVSLEKSGLSQQQAKGVTEALRKGGTIAIPAGAVSEAIARMSAPALPDTVYTQLQDTRNRVQYIFGTHGFTPSGGGGKDAVRSQILNKNIDEARISGGFSEYLEQLADNIYTYWIQLLYVYNDKYASNPKKPVVKLTVKEGSLLPKDSTALASQAVQLANGGKMALIDLYKKLEYPNPDEMAANVWLEANAPEILFANDPRVAQAIQMKQQAAQAAAGGEKKGPSESINFKDLPPEGKAQMAKQAGIELHSEGIAAHDDVVHQRSKAPTQPSPVNDLAVGQDQNQPQP